MIILKDGRVEPWLYDELYKISGNHHIIGSENPTTKNRKRTRIQRIFILHFDYIKIAIKSLKIVKSNDTLVCLLDIIGVYALIFSFISFKRNKILLVNIMVNDDNSIISSLKIKIFRKILSNKKVFGTVNTFRLREYYKKTLKFDTKRIFLLKDSYTKYSYLQKNTSVNEGYVFVGGSNARDWEMVYNVANKIPDQKFVVVSPKTNENLKSLKNVKLFTNVNVDVFIRLLSSSSICWLPLTTQSAAGIIVLLQSALLRKPIISTSNIVMCDYVNDNVDGLLHDMGNVDMAIDQINKLNNSNHLYDEYSKKMFHKVLNENKPSKYLSDLHVIYKTTLK